MANIEEYAPNSGRVLDEDSNVVNMADITQSTVGAAGAVAITGTSAVTPPSGYYFYCIDPEGSIVVSDKSDVSGATNADLTAFTSILYPKYGKWSSITLNSGEAVGYLAKE